MKEICAAGDLTVSRVHTHIGSGSDPAVWQKVRADPSRTAGRCRTRARRHHAASIIDKSVWRERANRKGERSHRTSMPQAKQRCGKARNKQRPRELSRGLCDRLKEAFLFLVWIVREVQL